MKNERLDFIDFTRGIAAIVVLLSHAGSATGFFSDSGFGYQWLNLGQVGVIAFFAVSGFVIPLSIRHSKSMISFAIRRVFRIYPLFLFLLFLAVFLQIIGVNYPRLVEGNLFAIFVANVFFISDYIAFPNLVGGSWTLSIEIVWYVIFALVFVYGLSERPLLMAVVVSSVFVTIACISLISGMRFPLGRLGMLGICLVGYYFYKSYSEKISKKNFFVCVSMLLSSILILLWTAFSHYTGGGTTFRCVVISWSVGLMLFVLPFKFRASDIFSYQIFLMLGRYSYSIYLVHALMILVCLRIFETPSIQLLAIAITSFLVASVTYGVIEAPGILMGKKLDRLILNRGRSLASDI